MRLLAGIIGRLMAAYVRLVAATSRFEGAPVTQEQVVLAFWHEYNLVAAIVGLPAATRTSPRELQHADVPRSGDERAARLRRCRIGAPPRRGRARGGRAPGSRAGAPRAGGGDGGGQPGWAARAVPSCEARRADRRARVRPAAAAMGDLGASLDPAQRSVGPARRPASVLPHPRDGGGADRGRRAGAAPPVAGPPPVGARRGGRPPPTRRDARRPRGSTRSAGRSASR